jgi:acyl-CoA reductase-like NAD-dependent aldehyde dehydrogenase
MSTVEWKHANIAPSKPMWEGAQLFRVIRSIGPIRNYKEEQIEIGNVQGKRVTYTVDLVCDPWGPGKFTRPTVARDFEVSYQTFTDELFAPNWLWYQM